MKKLISSLLVAGCVAGCSSFRLNQKKDLVMRCFDRASKIQYQAEPKGIDYWKSPSETMRDKKGDCEDMAFYLEYLLKRQGIPCRTVMGRTNLFKVEKDNLGRIIIHAWVEYKINETPYVLDPTSGKIHNKFTIPFNYLSISTLKETTKNKKEKESYERIEKKLKEYYKRYFWLF